MKFLRRQKGFTLIEVMITMGTLAVLIYSYLEVRSLQTQLLTQVNFSKNLSEVMIENVTEAKIVEMVNLPTPGNCIIRLYNLAGFFMSERLVPSSDTACGQGPVKEGFIEVFWQASGAPMIDARFEPAKFLRLPKHKPSVVQLEILGRVKSPPPGPSELKLDAVIFRK